MKTLLFVAILTMCATTTGRAQSRQSRHAPTPGTWGVTFSGGVIGMGGDLTHVQSEYRYKPMGSLLVTRMLRASFQLGLFVAGGQLAADRAPISTSGIMAAIAAHGEYRLPVAEGMLAPLVFVQLGGIAAIPKVTDEIQTVTYAATAAPFVGAGLGLELVYRRRYGVRLMGGGLLTGTDKLDGLVRGPRKDGAAWLSLGISYFPSSR